jgi:uncharacterized protein
MGPAALDNLVAIDTHVHAMHPHERGGTASWDSKATEIERAAADYFDAERFLTIEETAEYYRSRSMMAVIFAVDSEAGTGRPRLDSASLIGRAAEHPDVLIPFASVDPWKGKRGIQEVTELISSSPVRGFKFHPQTQAFCPSDRQFYPFYEAIAAAGLPAIFHTGQTGIGAGLRGGGGIKLMYGNPMYLDEVAADFPDLTIIMAHPSVPWQDEALSVALHKGNVYIDLSGWSPKYFPPQLVHYSNTLLKDKVLFGSDFPMLTPDRWLKDFAAAEFRDEVRPLILKQNAISLLKLGQGQA